MNGPESPPSRPAPSPATSPAPVDRRTHRPLSAILLVVAAVSCFGVLDTTTKTVVAAVPVLMAVWVRYVIQALLSTALLWPAQGRALWHTHRPWMHALRGCLLLGSSLFAFASLKFIPVGEFTAIVMITPLVITLIANRFMHEQVSAWRWFFVFGGFAGALLIIRPGGEGFSAAWLLPVVVVVFNSGFQLLTSVLARTENPSTTHFYTGWVGTAIATLALPFVWTAVDDPTLWLRMLLMGVMGALGHFCLTIAYTRAPAAMLTPYLYGQIGTAMLTGWLVLGHVPDRWGVAGMLVIAVCGGASGWLNARATRRAN